MSLLVLADSQVDRIWRNVRQNRELLRTATYAPVKNFGQLSEGMKVITASVRIVWQCVLMSVKVSCPLMFLVCYLLLFANFSCLL